MQMKFIISLLFLVLIFTVTNASKYLAQKPDFLTPCSLDDPSFNQCLSRNLQGMFVQWKDGLPGTNSVGSLDPLIVKRFKFSQDTHQGIALNADLQNVQVTGGSQLIVKETSYNPTKYVAKSLVFLPKLRFDFNYKLKGHVLALSLNGQGKGRFESENVLMFMEMGVKSRTTPEDTFADVQKVKVVFREIGNFKIKLDNLFGGNTDLEQIAHTLFNDNWREFYEVMRPAIEQAIEAILLDRFKKTFDYVPATYFIKNFH